jgi:hypothetical protein
VGGGRLPGRLLRVGCLIRGRLLEDGVVFLDAAMVGGDGLLYVVTQVIPHVPPVGDLLGTGRALAGAQRITPDSVSADQLDAGVCAEPAGEGAVAVSTPTGPTVLRLQPGPARSVQFETGWLTMPAALRRNG